MWLVSETPARNYAESPWGVLRLFGFVLLCPPRDFCLHDVISHKRQPWEVEGQALLSFSQDRSTRAHSRGGSSAGSLQLTMGPGLAGGCREGPGKQSLSRWAQGTAVSAGVGRMGWMPVSFGVCAFHPGVHRAVIHAKGCLSCFCLRFGWGGLCLL